MATESNFVQPSIPKFDGHYDHWSMLMENFMRSKEYWCVVENEVREPVAGVAQTEVQQKKLEELKLKDLKAKNYLFQAIDRDLLETILQKDTSKQIWDAMKQKYQGSTRVKRQQLQALRKEFEVLHMKEGESVDEMKSNYLEKQALKVSTNWRNFGRGRGWFRGGRGRGRGGFDGGRGSFDKSNVECYRCHGYGHFKSECTSNLHYGRGEKANFAEKEEKEEEILLMAYHEGTNTDVWYLDSGCSNHMCGNKYLFSDYDEFFKDTMKLGNDAKMTVVGKGNIKLKIGGHVVKICDVFYVPDLKSNLISIGQLQEKGYTIIMRKGCCQIMHPEKGLIAQVTMTTNRMFPLHIQHDIQTCYTMQMSDASWLWHMRYGHLNFNCLRTLQQRSLVTGLPHITCSTRVCEECVIGKQHRDPFPKAGAWRAKTVLQLVHLDICGPIHPVSNGNKRYFITFTDDFSRKTWVYFMEQKSEAFGVFKSFKTLVEKESGKEIKILRYDRGGEYNSSAFMSFCASYGIRRQLTTAYSP
ncbi:putative RNA-directed DNA polymerase [Rosa chinensis]|uniref:Putative RNA-directed DNA polymerase n=1 Tax=Rosa chinensis TaxID=74649 RepID=A0A2P6SBD7_ROSCH|nr:putative RNA-directed DNA polymerase [Rosa chinensis]